MTLDELRLIVQPGRGIAARRGPRVIFVADPSEPALDDLLRVIESGEPSGVIDMLFDVVRLRRPTLVSAFCALVEDEGQLRVAIHGALELAGEDAEGSIHLAGRDARSRVEDSLGEDVKELAVAGKTPKASRDPFSDLIEGVVPAGGITLVQRGAEPLVRAARAPAAARPAPAPVAEPVAEEVVGTVLGGPPPVDVAMADVKRALTMAVPVGPAPFHAEAPEVEGRLCSNGHLNSPQAATCWICSARVGQEAAQGARPPLGRLTTKDKRSYVVDGDFVIGRKPDVAPDVLAGKARGIEVPVTEQTVSRVHAEIRLRGWDVVALDRKSSNGTYYLPPGGTEWQRVDSDGGTRIVPGTTITVGGFELYFEGL